MSEIIVETEQVVQVIETESAAATVVETSVTAVEVVAAVTEVVVEDDSATVVEVVETGPQTFILPEEMEMYAKRVDFISETLLYRGEAAPGSAESAAVWRIRRITFAADDDVSEVWAGGDATFDQIWDDRLSLVYS
ncbi:MAG: hypothetical protein U9Q19_02665 [Pseudomonadota bacterium]|nr:hypothetical protein [Pseudomonadota bacterium]